MLAYTLFESHGFLSLGFYEVLRVRVDSDVK